MIEVTRGPMKDNGERRYCLMTAMKEGVGVRTTCSENPDNTWALLTAIGKPRKLGRLRDVADLDEGEAWTRWIAEQVLDEERDIRKVHLDVKHSQPPRRSA